MDKWTVGLALGVTLAGGVGHDSLHAGTRDTEDMYAEVRLTANLDGATTTASWWPCRTTKRLRCTSETRRLV